jgi:hypothetical protein
MNFQKHLEVFANTAMAIAAVLLSIVLVKEFLLPRPQRAFGGRAGVASKVSLPGVDWAKSRKTLVLALSTQCHFCTESAPFFQRVAKTAAGRVKLLAVLPQPTVDAQNYLRGVGGRVDDVRQAPLDSIGVAGTPTLLFVNDSGTVTNVWTGKLSADKQAEVLHVLENSQLLKQ